jgi:ABC-type spermidine/putrescine transport system permease subunit I
MLRFIIFSLHVALRSIDHPQLRAAAATLGAKRLRTFFMITLPLIMPGLSSSP